MAISDMIAVVVFINLADAATETVNFLAIHSMLFSLEYLFLWITLKLIPSHVINLLVDYSSITKRKV